MASDAATSIRKRRSSQVSALSSRSQSQTARQCSTIIIYAIGISGILAVVSFLVWHNLIQKSDVSPDHTADYIKKWPYPERPFPQQRPQRWKCGLRNLGNTCYMNSALQCLRHNQIINHFLNEPGIFDMIERRRLSRSHQARWISEYNDLLDGFEYGEERGRCRRIDPAPIYNAMLRMAPRVFRRHQQQDALEVFQHFFEAIESVLAANPRATAAWYSIARRLEVVDRRRWDRAGMLMAPNPEVVNPHLESSYNLPLILPDQNEAISLELLLDRYFNEPRTNLGEAGFSQETKRIRAAPDVLVIALNRIDLRLQRIWTPVYAPFRLNLQPFMENGAMVEYDLVAVVNHLGHGAESGHYVAIARSGPGSDQWFLFDDENVSRMAPENVVDTRYVFQIVYQRRRL